MLQENPHCSRSGVVADFHAHISRPGKLAVAVPARIRDVCSKRFEKKEQGRSPARKIVSTLYPRNVWIYP
jgi:hypothetical protein